MTLKSFFFQQKRLFSAWERIFYTGISIIGLFPLRLYCIWAYRSCHFWLTALNSNLSLNSSTELWLEPPEAMGVQICNFEVKI